MRQFLLKFYRIVLMRIYSNSTILLMELLNPLNPLSQAVIREVTEATVDDALSFQTKQQTERFRSFLKNGDRGFYGYMKDRCIHRSWVVSGPSRVFLHKFYSMNLQPNEIFIQFCETASAARGKNVFAHVLSFIGNQYAGHRVLTSVDEGNPSSIRSMTKAGFVAIDRIKIKVILGFRFITRELK